MGVADLTGWEIVQHDGTTDRTVERLRIPGGWIYLVRTGLMGRGRAGNVEREHAVFVPVVGGGPGR